MTSAALTESDWQLLREHLAAPLELTHLSSLEFCLEILKLERTGHLVISTTPAAIVVVGRLLRSRPRWSFERRPKMPAPRVDEFDVLDVRCYG
jgi:hypothetical protein